MLIVMIESSTIDANAKSVCPVAITVIYKTITILIPVQYNKVFSNLLQVGPFCIQVGVIFNSCCSGANKLIGDDRTAYINGSVRFDSRIGCKDGSGDGLCVSFQVNLFAACDYIPLDPCSAIQLNIGLVSKETAVKIGVTAKIKSLLVKFYFLVTFIVNHQLVHITAFIYGSLSF